MSVESGIRPGRLEFVREDTPGVTPTDPEWLRYSNSYQSVSYTPNTTISNRRKVGSYDVQDFFGGSEDHAFEVNYDMQRWFVDGSGDPLDAAADGILRNSYGELINTHSVVEMIYMGGNGNAGGGSRQYVVSTGCKMDNISLTGEPDSGEPMNITASYIAEKSRVYRVDQPAAATILTVVSSDASDTTQSFTIEADDGGTSEVVDLNGTTPVNSIATFASLDAAMLSAECEGDVTITDDADNVLMVIRGRGSYQDREGDLGVSPLGSGSRGAEIVGAYESLLGDVFLRGGDLILEDVEISNVTLTVSNNLDAQPSHKTIGKRINEGDRDVTLSTTVFGPTASYDVITEHLTIAQADIVWTLSGGTITLPGAALTEPGSIQRETSQATMSIDNTFTSKGIEFDA